jgi:hypothetical protein
VTVCGDPVAVQYRLCKNTACFATAGIATCKMGSVSSRTGDRSFKRTSDAALGPWERWTTDERGEPIVEWDDEGHAQWCRQWAPGCPDGRALRVRQALGFWERSLCELELRVALGGDEDGVCRVVVDEREDEIFVRVLIHSGAEHETRSRNREYLDCPVRVWLEHPLGMRAVIDVDSDEELSLYTPAYLNNVPQPDHGYRRVNRRRATTASRVAADTPGAREATSDSKGRKQLDSVPVGEREQPGVERDES